MTEKGETPAILFRIALVGDSGAGKTAIMLRYTDDIFYSNTQLTIGVEWKFKTMQHNGKKVTLQIWDTAGQERFSSLAPLYCRKADAVLLFYDVTRLESFQNVEYWSQMIDVTPQCEFVLVGNKIDREQERVVSSELGECRARDIRNGVRHFETSAKDNLNIDTIFEYLVPLMMKNKSKLDPKVGTIELHRTVLDDHKTTKEGCCQKS